MDLKGRLGLIAAKVKNCNVMCDIGTDHGYIPIAVVENSICNKAIAADVKQGPLDAASANIELYGLKDKIETRLGNGLAPIKNNEVDAIVIAGMGGILIRDILLNDFEKVKRVEQLVLQPMNAIEALREWLYQSGFEIYDEELAQEGDKFYTVISAKWTGAIDKHEMFNYYIGEKLIKRGGEIFTSFIKKKLELSEKILSELENCKQDEKDLKELHEYLVLNYKGLLNSNCNLG